MKLGLSRLRKPQRFDKRALLTVLYAIYITFILVSTVPYLAKEDATKGDLSNGEYESHLVFPDHGTYGYYQNVVLFDNTTAGRIDLKYIIETNTLYIQRLENIKELKIDCQMMFTRKSEEVLGENPVAVGFDYYKTYFLDTNDGFFTVIINSDNPIEKLQFTEIPQPKRVMVNNKDWWETSTTYYSVTGDDITISHIPEGTTTVNIYFQELTLKSPVAKFGVSKYITLPSEEIYFDADESEDEDGEILHYLWDFGDGIQSSGILIRHTYTKIANYTVTLTVRDDDYLEDTYSLTIYVVSSDTDSDGDGVADLVDPHPHSNIDTDRDGISDDFETIISLTNITALDSDGDGWDDKIEWESGSNPNDPFDFPTIEKESDETGSDDSGLIIGALVVILIILFIFILLILKKRSSDGKPEPEEEQSVKKPFLDLKKLSTSFKGTGKRKPAGKDEGGEVDLSPGEEKELEELEKETDFLVPSDRKIIIKRFLDKK